MIEIRSLNKSYSTTKLLTKEKPNIENGPEDKFEINRHVFIGRCKKEVN